jgi:plasmid stabilization system protein ParE
MKRPYFLVFHPKATKELLEAVDWYNERQPDLGDTFFEFVLVAIKRIIQNPFLYAPKSKTYREALVEKFPYIVIYRIKPKKNEVEIMAVFHTSRNPTKKYKV